MVILKNLKLFLFLLLTVTVIVSCTKENIVDPNTDPGTHDPTVKKEQNTLLARSNPNSQTSGLDFDCFYVLYPFDMVDDQGTNYTVGDDDEFFALISDSSTLIIDFVYPLLTEDEDGNQTSVADANELGELFASCLPNGWSEVEFPAYLINMDNSCYDLVYPIQLTNADGDIVTAADEQEFISYLSEEPYSFVFPFSLSDEDGVVTIVNDIDELFSSLVSCGGITGDTTYWNNGVEYLGCYELVFPFSLVLADGTVVEVTNHMEYCDLLLEGMVAGFAYPLTLIDEDGNTHVVNSEEELTELLHECVDILGDPGDLMLLYIGSVDSFSTTSCYSINFPINADEVDENGDVISNVTIGSQAELVILDGFLTLTKYYNIEFPVSVTLTSDGSVVVFDDLFDIIEQINDCN